MSVITFSDSSPGDCVSIPCSTNLTSSDDLTTEIVETSSARGGKEKEKFDETKLESLPFSTFENHNRI
jgi:hypothetical protein